MARAILPIFACLARLVVADSMRQGDTDDDISGVQIRAIIPALIVVATTILSLEIFDVTLVSRPLSAVTITVVWTGILHEELQLSSLLAAIIYHCIQEVYIERLRGFPCISQAETARRMSLWSLFWTRVVVWGATMATTSALFKGKTHGSPGDSLSFLGALVVARTALFHAVYCECAEVLVRMYFFASAIKYDWRRRWLLFLTSFSIGILQATGLFPLLIASVQHRVSSAQLVIALVVWMWISIRTPWPLVVDQAKHAVVFISSAFHHAEGKSSEVQPTNAKRRRSSILYRSTSDVEVVEMTAEFHAYELRNMNTGHHHFS